VVVTLKYRDYKPVVTQIKVVSTPGRKKYASFRVCAPRLVANVGMGRFDSEARESRPGFFLRKEIRISPRA
jgi:hypothetical protein